MGNSTVFGIICKVSPDDSLDVILKPSNDIKNIIIFIKVKK